MPKFVKDRQILNLNQILEDLGKAEVYEDEDGNRLQTIYLGSILSLTPSGKIYYPFAYSNLTPCPRCKGSAYIKNKHRKKKSFERINRIIHSITWKTTLWNMTPNQHKKVMKLRKTNTGGHADEEETSMILAHRPELVHPDRADQQSGEDLNRLDLPYTYTGIWWYAKYPNHYAGDGSYASKELGNLLLDNEAEQLAVMIRGIKADKTVIELQNEFYDKSAQPVNTKQ